MKYTLFLTHRCNLKCDYCYVSKSSDCMPLNVARRIIEFTYQNTPPTDDIDIGFFGGEPLLEFPVLRTVTQMVRSHPSFDPCRVNLSLTTNGTLLTPEIIEFLAENDVLTTISCDGPPAVHDQFRRMPCGEGSSPLVERGIRTAMQTLRHVPVNAVYGPQTLAQLPATIDYFSSLGVREIYLNPDFSARWTPAEVDSIPDVYGEVAARYMRFYRERRPHYISLIDSKITVLLRGGYHDTERCHMGEREFAFTASGRVLPCERFASEDPERHSIGTANGLIRIDPLRNHFAPGPPINTPCLSCTLQPYCENWCGCANYFMSGHYNRVGPFLCASERASIQLAFDIFRTLESELGPTFMDHLGGRARTRSIAARLGDEIERRPASLPAC
jgi:uncharacterized protein